MSAVRAVLEPRVDSTDGRTQPRRKLCLQAQGRAAFGSTNVIILNVSTTGLLLQTDSDLTDGETIELDFPRAARVSALVRWSGGNVFGCQFEAPLSKAVISAALLRAPFARPGPTTLPMAAQQTLDVGREAGAEAVAHESFDVAPDTDAEPLAQDELSHVAKLRWILALALVSWAVVGELLLLAWRLLR